MASSVIQQLEKFGATESELLLFSKNDSRVINYDSLLSQDDDLVCPDGVIELVGRPVLYFISGRRLDNSNLGSSRLNQLMDALSCRGERASLLVVGDGCLDVYPILPSEDGTNRYTVNQTEAHATGFIRDYLEGYFPRELQAVLKVADRKSAVEDLLFNALKGIGQRLNATKELGGQHEAILGLIGRALLTRFLLDRDILTQDTAPSLLNEFSGQDLFSSARSTALTNAWLDITFNGDLLELPVLKKNYAVWFSTLSEDVFLNLSFILGHTDINGQLSLPGFINFAHVPVGMLSEVYERYAHENLDDVVSHAAKKESIHYTPRNIAEYMLAESFSSVTTCEKQDAKILDPSCGAGVFIVLAFRRLIREHWKKYDQRPDTYQIRKILYNQISGFDINKSALTLSALGLYLSALELDADPLPTSKLKFEKNLIGTVLHLVRENEAGWQSTVSVMGSLGDSLPSSHNHKYDIVIGNPPWSNFDASLRDQLTECVKSIAKGRNLEGMEEAIRTYKNPDQVPDIPFVWKSTQWAKYGATIAFTLHARLLFKNSEIGVTARNLLFSSINVTGVLNGSLLRQTNVWPRISAPFCLLFAKNEVPSKSNYFHLLTPQYERELNNSRYQLRIDYQSANPIQPEMMWEKPYLLKVLSCGTALDVAVIDHMYGLIENGKAMPIKKYWHQEVGKLRSGVGYQKSSDKEDSTALIETGALNLDKESPVQYVIDESKLENFQYERLHRKRAPSIYATPLVVVNKAIGASKETVSARISLGDKPIAYHETFYGYSCVGSNTPRELAKFLFAVLNSDLLVYYLVMTSSQYAVEREVCHKADIDSFPLLDYDKFSNLQKEEISDFFDYFRSTPDISKLNDLVFDLYELSKLDREVVLDTLAVSAPIKKAKARAQASVSNHDEELFLSRFKEIIKFKDVTIISSDLGLASWKFFTICTGSCTVMADRYEILAEIAAHTGASKIVIHGKGYMCIGMINQYRYWTPSRARLLALSLIEDYPKFWE